MKHPCFTAAFIPSNFSYLKYCHIEIVFPARPHTWQDFRPRFAWAPLACELACELDALRAHRRHATNGLFCLWFVNFSHRNIFKCQLIHNLPSKAAATTLRKESRMYSPGGSSIQPTGIVNSNRSAFGLLAIFLNSFAISDAAVFSINFILSLTPNCGGRIRTCVLLVMGQMRYRTSLPRDKRRASLRWARLRRGEKLIDNSGPVYTPALSESECLKSPGRPGQGRP